MPAPQLHFVPGTPAVWAAVWDLTLDLHAVADRLIGHHPTLAWLDSARTHPVTGRFSILAWDPWLTASAHGTSLTVTASGSTTRSDGHPLTLFPQILARYARPRGAGLPPVGLGWIGLLSYELNRWIERLPAPKPVACPVPELLMFGMRQVLVVDHAEPRSWAVSIVDPHQPSAKARREARARLEELCEWAVDANTPSSRDSRVEGPESFPPDVEAAMSQAQFETMVRKAKDHIAAGDIFQANLAHQLSASWSGSAWALYQRLRTVNPSPFACFMTCPEFSIVSCSPERLVRVQDGMISTRPIAGTRPRGKDPAEDVLNSLELILSDKERAEHIMLVDLERNDLGRVCRFGSVRVDELMTLEEYSHVIHIVSNISGRAAPGIAATDVIRAMFPGGTITGCPKVRCMDLIQELEPVARGAYTGSVGYLNFDGAMDWNLLIRTMVMRQGRVWFHVGAGIVADSEPAREYQETLAKAAAMLRALHPQVSRPATLNAFVGSA